VEKTTGSAIFKSGRAAKSNPVLQHIPPNSDQNFQRRDWSRWAMNRRTQGTKRASRKTASRDGLSKSDDVF
jgi:hypothetical protein